MNKYKIVFFKPLRFSAYSHFLYFIFHSIIISKNLSILFLEVFDGLINFLSIKQRLYIRKIQHIMTLLTKLHKNETIIEFKIPWTPTRSQKRTHVRISELKRPKLLEFFFLVPRKLVLTFYYYLLLHSNDSKSTKERFYLNLVSP